MTKKTIFDTQVLGHPAGLFVLFFTEMWERFSFYGMRVLLINFLTMTLIGYNPGWAWSTENAGALFGTYVMLLYLTPILGGIIADKITGYRWAVIIGAVIITLGHVSMAFETEVSLYLGLALLVIGTGFFKPNMVSFVSEMYKDLPEKKDAAYTIFYMGVNSGAFFGMMLCGYLAERIGWSWGFGLAGVFMLLGTIQFWFAKPLFGSIGCEPRKQEKKETTNDAKQEEEKLNPFTTLDKILVALSAIIGIGYALNDPLSKIWNIDLFGWAATSGLKGQYVMVIVGLIAFFYLIGSRIMRYTTIVRDRMLTVVIFAFFVVFFWLSFEQGASSLVIFARDNIERELHGNWAVLYNIFNALLTVIPLLLITYVLFLLIKKTYKKIFPAVVVLLVCFSLVWGIASWMLQRDFKTTAYSVSYQAYEQTDTQGRTTYIPITEENRVARPDLKIVERTTIIGVADYHLKVGQEIKLLSKNNKNTSFGYVDAEKEQWAKQRGAELNTDNGLIVAQVKEERDNWVETTVSWFSILNSFFIIALASLFSRWWDSKYNPPAAMKYGIGLLMLSVGFGLLALGSHGVTHGVKVSMLWLVFAYMFNTMGELCLSPVGLSYVSKLVPARMIAFMFGVWYLAVAIGHKLAAVLGGQIENITREYSLSTFFLIFTIVPAVAGVLIILINPFVKKLMHGVR
ncbi:TGF-beta receptor type I/II extracellular region [Capnocytophaga ochracea DSM 7271]|jgi:amino acid/peptide transporter|uniref:TGF-beta receptor type I/II extracellular region n=1 Tax=Capnocytophaga ochracea (strain ATCC 27872 / DSM 7271 / CCUG 9716 / JCM 12966 / NCTC 12371 / SS31 / VPI 2845) TaxID=521097 RepID=C7M6B8_CAPOD|nr:peptide MFS transporter [Capnocytophaga ochracea]ACU92984.1 TGF-beta receptor type I/II extracellular region [Capnocytophaga ochracea DSM 7271]UAK51687.1 peptide MFS transporter [Capnocytophaga ochracea]